MSAPGRLAWLRLDAPGRDEVALRRTHDGLVAEGRSEGPGYRCAYTLRYDAAWKPLAAEVREAREGRTLRLARDGERWTVDALLRPDLDGCEDVDLSCSPFTNTPPVLRHKLAPGEGFDLEAVHVLVDPLRVQRSPQRYDGLPPGPRGARVRYRNRDSGFQAELSLDGQGFVVEYAGLFRRVA